MKINSINNNQQNFGMAIHSNETVNKIIKSRIKNTQELNKLNNIIESAKNNNAIDVTLLANPDGKTISANIYSTSKVAKFFTSRSENFFTKNFSGGIVGFIDKCSKIANKNAHKIVLAEKIENSQVFNKMK